MRIFRTRSKNSGEEIEYDGPIDGRWFFWLSLFFNIIISISLIIDYDS